MQMTVKAYAKINWALNILGRREDGYHMMDMLMQNIDLYDTLSFSPARFVSLEVDGRPVTNNGKNLVVRAAAALNEYMGANHGARIRMKKRIPVRAGLGGGSADCAAALFALNEMWNLRLPSSTLMAIGEKLGADVPYCLRGGLCRVSGIGEALTPLDHAREYPMLLTMVGQGLSTQAVFADFDENGGPPLDIDIMAVNDCLARGRLEEAQALSGNALEGAALRLLPEISPVMAKMREAGAAYVRMSGSGSAVYGVFHTDEEARRAQKKFPSTVFVHTRTENGYLLEEGR